MMRIWLLAAALCVLGPWAAVRAETQPPTQVLVMLRAAAPHLRAADGYAVGYTASPDENARMHTAREIAQHYGLHIVDSWPMPALGLDCFVMRLAPGMSASDVTQQLAQDARVESAEPRQAFHTLAKDDPLYALQPVAKPWHLAELHAVASGRHVTIAEVDSGVDTSNPDLTGQVLEQRNFVDDGDYRAELHGTEVAGIIVAREGNGVGIAGVAPQAQLLALRACWQLAQGSAASACDSFTLAKALQYALEKHVQIINLSLTGPDDRLLQRLLDAALAQRVAVVVAVDDSAADGGFPASYKGVLAVAGERSPAQARDVLLAPAEDIPTTQPGARWNLVNGSSFAAAEVSGLVALLHELSPDITLTQLHDALHARTALGLVSMRPKTIDACAAVAQVSQRCICDCAATHASLGEPRR
ncbi:S8 family peptidase [Dyella nitratireducens]|uniref:Serine protease n=1 Tax=Dyella nitratireducens TaxID=1849580 RepID=A0ABQ1FUI7_9GAMM|nr:S8 family serine peptidase [Dyella nitratireducens]GGA30051.1 serine protease [Dyella nitratireducens]GLQ43058.1 serine protease [Dyella nitratireducens]